jgi:hypothetical protein
MGLADDLKNKTAELVQSAVMNCRASAADVRRDAQGETLSGWRTKHAALAGAAAGGNLIGGPLAFAALAIEIPALLNIMSRAALGIGAIVTGDCSDDDYEPILAVWAGALELDGDLRKAVQSHLAGVSASTLASKAGVSMVTTVAGAGGAKIAAKAALSLNSMMLSAAIGAVIGRKVMLKGGARIAAGKMAGKIVSGLPTRFMPLLGAAVAAGLNIWFVNGIMDAAERYYGFLKETAEVALPAT